MRSSRALQAHSQDPESRLRPFCPVSVQHISTGTQSDLLKVSAESKFVSCNYDGDVDVDTVYGAERGNYGNSHMTWMQNYST